MQHSNFTLLYTENCTVKIKLFDDYEKVKAFVGAFTIKHLDNNEDNVIDAIIQGIPITVSPHIEVSHE